MRELLLLNKAVIYSIVIVLRVRLMVGHLPLEQGIGVRVPDPQHQQHLVVLGTTHKKRPKYVLLASAA